MSYPGACSCVRHIIPSPLTLNSKNTYCSSITSVVRCTTHTFHIGTMQHRQATRNMMASMYMHTPKEVKSYYAKDGQQSIRRYFLSIECDLHTSSFPQPSSHYCLREGQDRIMSPWMDPYRWREGCLRGQTQQFGGKITANQSLP